MKLYFEKDNLEYCYEKSYFIEKMERFNIDEMVLFEAIRELGSDYFWCKKFSEAGDTKDCCGLQCTSYIANNGKNGRCRHWGYCYVATDKKLILRSKKDS